MKNKEKENANNKILFKKNSKNIYFNEFIYLLIILNSSYFYILKQTTKKNKRIKFIITQTSLNKILNIFYCTDKKN